MADRLAGRVALITGGCGDIGRAISAAFAREGATVVAVDLLAPEDAQQALGQAGYAYVRCDVADRAAVREMIAEVEARHGAPEIVVANAGIVQSAPILEVGLQNWQQTLDVNLGGAFHVAQEAASALVRLERPGVLLFTGSWVGEVPSRGLLPYCVSKAGVQMLARCLALELAPRRIRANVVAPGILDAGLSAQIFRQFPERRAPFERIVPLGELGTAEQVADAMVFLASDEAAYITGTTLEVDGSASLFQYQT